MASRDIDIGDTRVLLLSDGIFETGRDALIHTGGDAARAAAQAAWGDRPLRMDVNVALLRGPRGIELVDAGTGPSWGPSLGLARTALAAQGVAPEAVDRVYLTHLHGDHALGLLDGEAAYFPRAEVMVPAADLAFFSDPAERARVAAPRQGAFDVARRVATAYGTRLVALPFGPVTAGLDLLPLPGHTPGQGGYLVTPGRPGAAALLLLADALHLADLQAGDPEVGLIFDLDPARAAQTRRAILDRVAAEGWVMGGAHLPGFARVAPDGRGFRLSPA